MTTTDLRSGTQTDAQPLVFSSKCAETNAPVKNLADLLSALDREVPAELPMLKTTCNLISAYLQLPPDQIALDQVQGTRDGFRSFLVNRRNKPNSIKTYMNHLRILLNHAKQFGWQPFKNLSEEWLQVLRLAKKEKCGVIAGWLAQKTNSPFDVTEELVDSWVRHRVVLGYAEEGAKANKSTFWRILASSGWTKRRPLCLVRERKYGVPVNELPLELKAELSEILRWKVADFAMGRPHRGKIRAITAKALEGIICRLYGFAKDILHDPDVCSMRTLVRKDILSAFVEWLINERKAKTSGILSSLGSLFAVLRTHPSYGSLDLSWLKMLLEYLPREPESELKKRKAAKFLEYSQIEQIPPKIRTHLRGYSRKSSEDLAIVAMDELLFRWLSILPWRQRNIRECRVTGVEPNLFFAPIPSITPINRPIWVIEQEQQDPNAKFWQFHFSPDETKTHVEIHALLPRQLIHPLEEYLDTFRSVLIKGTDPGTLFLNLHGRPLSRSRITSMIAQITQRLGGRRVTPHMFRDIVAYTWLHEHPDDFLTLSRMLWHKNVNTTINKYGSRFNESSGVCAMEVWLEKREGRTRSK